MFESRGHKHVGGNCNIKLLDVVNGRTAIFHVRMYDHLGREYWVEVKTGIPKGRKWSVLTEVVRQLSCEKKIAYGARVYIDDASWDGIIVKGRVQLWVPLDVRLSVEPRLGYGVDSVDSVLGIDHNFDRMNLVLVDLDGRILHVETVDLTRFVTQGRCGKDLDTYIVDWFRRFITRLWLGGYKPLVVTEDFGVLGYLKIRWMVRGRKLHEVYNYLVSRFDVKTLELIHDTCEKLGIPHINVDPRGTTNSKEHGEAMAKYGLDRHTASAFLIAKRGLEHIKIKTYKKCMVTTLIPRTPPGKGARAEAHVKLVVVPPGVGIRVVRAYHKPEMVTYGEKTRCYFILQWDRALPGDATITVENYFRNRRIGTWKIRARKGARGVSSYVEWEVPTWIPTGEVTILYVFTLGPIIVR